jgi:hypothetical protein
VFFERPFKTSPAKEKVLLFSLCGLEEINKIFIFMGRLKIPVFDYQLSLIFVNTVRSTAGIDSNDPYTLSLNPYSRNKKYSRHFRRIIQ